MVHIMAIENENTLESSVHNRSVINPNTAMKYNAIVLFNVLIVIFVYE